MIIINRSIRAFQPNLASIFATFSACKIIYDSVPIRLKFDIFETKIANESILGDYRIIRIKYSYANVVECLKDQLYSLSRKPQFTGDVTTRTSIGIDLGELGSVLGVVIMGDHGGDSMSFLAEFELYEGCGQKHTANLGEFEGKESYFSIENTIIPHILEGVKILDFIYVLFVIFDGGFDFVFIPKNVITIELVTEEQRSRIPEEVKVEKIVNTNTLSATWSTGEAKFIREDIPENYSTRCLPIASFTAGDMAYLMMLQGRENYKSNKCPHCLLSQNLRGNNWQRQEDSIRGRPITCEVIKEEADNYISAHNNEFLTNLNGEELEQIKSKSALENSISGIQDKYMLLPMPLIPPVLHINLGITNYLNDHIFKFICDNIEPDLAEVVAKKAEIALQKNLIQHNENEIVTM